MRPSSGSSTRSRRDQVWEEKRQRWIARQGRGYGGGGGGGPSQGQRQRPPQLSEPPMHVAAAPAPVAPKSPLSRLVSEGYDRGAQQPASAHHPYGERPSSGSCGGLQQNPSSRGSSCITGASGGGGFDAGVAGQWNQNVQRDVQNRQDRHDPGVAGPPLKLHGGQRITQAPGGGASIDLSWGATQGSGSSAGAHPPRMPGPPGGQAGMGPGGMGPGGNAHNGQQAAAGPVSAQYADGQRYARGISPARQLSHSPSHAMRGGGGGGFSSPWGRDDDTGGGRQQAMPVRQQAPFGVDSQPQPVAGGAGMRRASPSPHHKVAPDAYYGEVAAAGCAPRGRAAGRPPGGASSFVFG